MTQTLIAATLVALAAGWLARRFYFTIAAAFGGNVDSVGSCGGCSGKSCKTGGQVVQLGISRPKPPADSGA